MAPVVKNPPANAGDIRNAGLIPGLGRSPGGGHCKGHHQGSEDNPQNGEKILGNPKSDKGLMSRPHKELITQKDCLMKHGHKCTDTSAQKTCEWAMSVNRRLTPSAIRGMKSKITVTNHFRLPCWSGGYESP